MEARQSNNEKNAFGVISYIFLGMISMFLFFNCCDHVVDEPVATVELHSGYSYQLAASSSTQWGSENPSVASVSSTGLVTAVGAGTTAIYTYTSGSERKIICYLEVFPKRNILFYTVTDKNGLDHEPRQQIDSIRKGWVPGKGEMLIYTDQSNRQPCLMRVNETRDANGWYGIDTIHVYDEENSADAAVLGKVINTVVSEYPADSYGMMFFSHASGWLPEGMLARPRSLAVDNGGSTRHEMEYVDFVAAIPDRQFDFILFDACFMADAIVMYELRNKTGYVLASSAEIVSPGFTPLFKSKIMRLFDTKEDVQSVITDFGQSYVDYIKSSYTENDVFCSATLGLIKTGEMQNLSAAVKAALNGIKLDESTLQVGGIQQFDRPNELISSVQRKSRYFDLGHVMENLASASQYAAFQKQMDKTVVWKASTKRFLLRGDNGNPYYSEYDGFFIEHHSGLSTYIEQAVYPELNSAYRNSAWYKAIY